LPLPLPLPLQEYKKSQSGTTEEVGREASDPWRSACMIRCTETSHATLYDCLLNCGNSTRCCVLYSLPRGRESMHAGCKTILSRQLQSSASIFKTRSLHFRILVHASMSSHAPAESTSRFDQAGQPIASFFAPWQYTADMLLVRSLRYHQGRQGLSAIFHAV